MSHKALPASILLFFFSLPIVHTQPDRIDIPFRTAGKTIVVQGTVDGRTGNLIIDTGVAKMLLNQRYLDNNETFSTRDHGGFQSVNGVSRNAGITLVFLEIAEFSTKTAAEVIDLSAVEKQKGIEILGIAGIEIFRKFELEIDFFLEEIRLYTLDKEGNRQWQEPQPLPSTVLPFQYEGHIPCITVNLNGQPLNLGLDTGAELNLLASHVYEGARQQYPHVSSVKLLGLNGNPTTALATKIDNLQVGALTVPAMPTVFAPLNTHYGGLDGKNIHGLLGYPFFQHYRTAVNFKKKEVYLWDAQSMENAPVARGRN